MLSKGAGLALGGSKQLWKEGSNDKIEYGVFIAAALLATILSGSATFAEATATGEAVSAGEVGETSEVKKGSEAE